MNIQWNEIIESESKKQYFVDLMTYIDKERSLRTIFPPRGSVFNAFKLCPFHSVKVVIIGQDPYHDTGQAQGLSFSVNEGVKIPPSLRNIYKELHADLNVDIPTNGDLSSWAKQGVLLLNTILTVEQHIPLSHKGRGWEQFTDNVIQLLNKDDSPKVFVFWGNNARKKNSFITNQKHLVIESSHPSPLSARHSFFGSRVFTKINHFLKSSQLSEINFEL